MKNSFWYTFVVNRIGQLINPSEYEKDSETLQQGGRLSLWDPEQNIFAGPHEYSFSIVTHEL